jgi:hypothetical protein
MTSINIQKLKQIISQCEYIIDGRFDINLRDVTLNMRGSSNQRILSSNDFEWDES